MNAKRWTILALTTAAAIASVPAAARAQVVTQQAASGKTEAWQAAVGVRSTFIRSAGFDPFSDHDVLHQFTLTAEHVFIRRGAFGFAAGLGGEFGGSDAVARGAPATLSVWRFSALAEGRYQPWQRAYGFVRVAPGLLRMNAILADASSPNSRRLEDTFSLPAADASAGAAFSLTGPANPVAAWIIAEGGYGWAGGHHLLLAPPAAPRDQPKLAPVDLGTIDPRGAFLRLAVAITY